MMSKMLLVGRSGRYFRGKTSQIPKYTPLLSFNDSQNNNNSNGNNNDIINDGINNNNNNNNMYNYSQSRNFGRRIGQSSQTPRPPTRKQRKRYSRHLQKMQSKDEVHSQPGSVRALKVQHDVAKKKLLNQYQSGEVDRFLPLEGVGYNEIDMMIDDMMGNSSDLTSMADPTPSRMGHKFLSCQKLITSLLTEKKVSPSDDEICLLIRSYRDNFSRRHKPMGIPKVLSYLLEKMEIPLTLMDYKSWNAILTCATSPSQASSLISTMIRRGIPPNIYTHSIMANLYAKRGDYRAIVDLLNDISPYYNMQNGTEQDLLPIYTSLLKACHTVVKRGATPHKLKMEAADIGWEKWKEMYRNNVVPDVMAYGALINLESARGQAEKCINILQEMHQSDVKPTPFCFTATLRAIAKSHEIALRFENGYAAKNLRRNVLISHHGKMTRQVLVLAEQAEVEHTEGFVAALIRCVGASGDFATAKAVYLASVVRKECRDLRPIGGDYHVDYLENNHFNSLPENLTAKINGGKNNHETIHLTGENNDDQNKHLDTMQQSRIAKTNSLKEYNNKMAIKEHGNDTRQFTALLTTYANAMKSKGLGDMWTAKDAINNPNNGVLCEFTLLNILKRREPEMHDNTIPGMDQLDVGRSGMTWEEEDVPKGTKQLKLKKWKGVDMDMDIGYTMDDIDPDMHHYFAKEDMERRFGKSKSLPLTKMENDNIDDDSNESKNIEDEDEDDEDEVMTLSQLLNEEDPNEEHDPLSDTITSYDPATNQATTFHVTDDDKNSNDKLDEQYHDIQHKKSTSEQQPSSQEEKIISSLEDQYYGTDQQETNTLSTLTPAASDHDRGDDEYDDPYPNPEDMFLPPDETYEDFLQNLKQEFRESGEDDEQLDEEEARQLYEEMQQMREKLMEKRGLGDGHPDDANFEKLYSEAMMGGEGETSNDDSQNNDIDNQFKQMMESEGGMGNDDDDDANFEEQFKKMISDAGMSDEDNDEDIDIKNQFKQMMKNDGDMGGDDDDANFEEQFKNMMSDAGMSDEDNDEDIDFENQFKQMMEDGELKKLMGSISDDDIENQFKQITSGDHNDDIDNQFNQIMDDDKFQNIMDGNDPEQFNDDISQDKLKAIMNGDDQIDFFDTGDSNSDGNIDTFSNNGHIQEAEYTNHTQSEVMPSTADQLLQREMLHNTPSSNHTTTQMTNHPLSLNDAFNQQPSASASPTLEDQLQSQPTQTPIDTSDKNDQLEEKDELDYLLPDFPKTRLRKIRKEFDSNLGDPSLLRLVPLLRENMPDKITLPWLKQKNLENAKQVMVAADQKNMVDMHVLNGMMHVEAVAGSLDRALAFHEDGYKQYKKTPTSYTDRLVLQMLLDNKRFPRALDFKRKVESKGRTLDLLSYGALIEYCGNRRQLGSALLLLEECIDTCGFPPYEKSLHMIRKMCREKGIAKKVGLEEMIGEDPSEWKRHGIKYLKKEKTKKGKRGVVEIRHRFLS